VCVCDYFLFDLRYSGVVDEQEAVERIFSVTLKLTQNQDDALDLLIRLGKGNSRFYLSSFCNNFFLPPFFLQ
jgi:hypothetical protein